MNWDIIENIWIVHQFKSEIMLFNDFKGITTIESK